MVERQKPRGNKRERGRHEVLNREIPTVLASDELDVLRRLGERKIGISGSDRFNRVVLLRMNPPEGSNERRYNLLISWQLMQMTADFIDMPHDQPREELVETGIQRFVKVKGGLMGREGFN